MIDFETELGAGAAHRLREETVVWLTTVSPRGAPLPMPVWFLWDGARSVVVYSQPGARVRNIAANPQVSLNFGRDGEVVVLSGRAEIDEGGRPADQDEDYLAKYDKDLPRIGRTPETFAERYSVPVRIELEHLRGH